MIEKEDEGAIENLALKWTAGPLKIGPAAWAVSVLGTTYHRGLTPYSSHSDETVVLLENALVLH